MSIINSIVALWKKIEETPLSAQYILNILFENDGCVQVRNDNEQKFLFVSSNKIHYLCLNDQYTHIEAVISDLHPYISHIVDVKIQNQQQQRKRVREMSNYELQLVLKSSKKQRNNKLY